MAFLHLKRRALIGPLPLCVRASTHDLIRVKYRFTTTRRLSRVFKHSVSTEREKRMEIAQKLKWSCIETSGHRAWFETLFFRIVVSDTCF